MSGVLAMVLLQLGTVAVVALGAGTFAPPLDRWLPWGRAFRRWRRRRLSAGMRALQRKAAPTAVPEPPVIAGYRDNAARRAEPEVVEPASALARYRALRAAKVVARWEDEAGEDELESPVNRKSC
ncbi:MAG TPA: hypothetical protein VLM85_27310 [Polyangiaceae bacterium]|nr:hypothetical protein [Polyangiaceae bacterium]